MRKFLKEMPVAGPIFKIASSLLRNLKDSYNTYNFYFKNNKFLNSNENLRDAEKGKKIFVLATGPSIKKQDLSLLKGQISISVSNFFVHPDFPIIKPKYHVFAPSHDPIPDSQIVIWFQDAEKHFPDGQEVFVALHDRFLVEGNNIFKKQKVRYYQIDYKNKGTIKNIDFTKRIPAIQTVNHLAMYVALYAGAEEIFLLGCDHDWILNLGKSRHFYEEKESALVREGYDEMKNRNMESEFINHLNLWRLYKNIRSYAEKRGVKIKNATTWSLLDVFPMVKLDEIFKK